MKKIIFSIFLFVIAIVMATSAIASDNTLPLLSELSDEECLQFLENNSIEMPPVFGDEGAWLLFVRSTIAKLEENPNADFPYNAFAMFQCAAEIKKAVNEYYGVSDIVLCIDEDPDVVLQDNTIVGVWSDVYNNYSSYGYAIDYYEPYTK